ncbi:MAG: tetratricopeptide repeat-containing serine/threonine-protein kinase [Acidobacteriota bacterium]|nr:tetratricopeptide repeat-containing serine/threonine-protein kinase [Acidobacteriota bacterium]
MSLASGTLIGRYVIAEQIGRGGMGEVYRARDPRLNRDVALKVLSPALTSDRAAVARFEREALSVSALQHPNIVHVYDVGHETVESQPVFFIAMELVDGMTLRRAITQRTDGRQLLKAVIDAGNALAKAHAAGIIHRDLKPENIMITADGYTKVLDFGLAKLIGKDPGGDLELVTAVRSVNTSAGMVVGTSGYMAPEQAQGRDVDRRSDIFSFGCVLYEAIAGDPPFRGNSVIDTLHQVLHREPSYERFPVGLQRVVRRCLAKSPGDRYQTIDDAVADLRTVAGSDALFARTSKSSESSARRKNIASIAVLPFINESGDPDTEYLSDGITETLINSLLQIPKLRVVPRNTVFRYKHRQDIAAVASELGVPAVLTGRVSHRADRIIVSADLTDTANDAQLWGDHYSRPVSDLLDVQKAIAADIAAHLRPRLSGQTRKRIVRIHTEDPEAYQLYLKGRYYLNKRSADAIRRAIDYFQQAIDRDPVYARGYAGLADAWVLLGWYAVERPRQAFPRALAAARQAVAIDASYAEAHTSAAYAMFLAEWDAAAAEKEFQHAIAINPDYAVAHHWYADLLQATGRAEQAVAQAQRACEIDPLALILNAELGRAFYYRRDYERAIEQQKKTLDLEPLFGPSLLFLGQAYDQSGRIDEAIDVFQRGVSQSGGNPIYRGYYGYALARHHDETAARRILEQLNEEAATGWIPSFAFALIAVGLQDHDATEKWLMSALDERSHWLLYSNADPAFDDLWRMERFAAVRQRVVDAVRR